MTRRFLLVDVFSDRPFRGNPLAVVLDGEGLTTEEMQRITRWMNLSETTFLLPPDDSGADYRVRIFTLERELPFAGHPTLGSCHAWLASGGRPRDPERIVQECGAGLVTLVRDDDTLAFTAPPLLRDGPVDEAKLQEVADAVRIAPSEIVDASWADNGPGWVALLLESAQAVVELDPVRTHPRRLDVGVVGPHEDGSDAAFELRAFFTDHEGVVREDPVTGSLNASVGQWLLATGRATAPYTASQGRCVGRDGRILITEGEDGSVRVGGATTTIVEGRTAF